MTPDPTTPPPAAPTPEPAPCEDGLAPVRRRLEAEGVDRSDLDADPFAQFDAWFTLARSLGVDQPEAMAIASAAGSVNAPSVRLVLLRGVDARGFTFFTNYESRKSQELTGNPNAAIVFPWHAISRQVRVVGAVERVSVAESDAYFASRPRGSQLSAWASPQSRVVADRRELDELRQSVESRWADRPVDRPPHWGGWRVIPTEIEFWQGRADRFHDRFRYQRSTTDAPWTIDRLGP